MLGCAKADNRSLMVQAPRSLFPRPTFGFESPTTDIPCCPLIQNPLLESSERRFSPLRLSAKSKIV